MRMAMTAPPEDRLLLLCARVFPAAAEMEALARLVREPLAWDAILTGAIRQGISTLVYRHLQMLDVSAAIPAGVMEQLAHIDQVTRLQVMRQRFEATRLLDLLHAAGVPVMPLKGLALRESIYPDPALRPSGDIDLLVRAEHVRQAESALQALGYLADETYRPRAWYRPETSHHLVPYRLPGREVQVEIHWDLAPSEVHLPVDVEAIWARAVAGQLAGRPTWKLAPEDLLLHLALHASLFSRFLTRLHHLVDVAETTRHYAQQLDWGRLAERARQWDAQRYLYLILRVANELLGLPDVDQAWADLRPAGFQEAFVPAVRQRVLAMARLETHEWTTDYLMTYALAPSAGEKLRVLWQALFPSRERMARLYNLPSESRWLVGHYLVRPFQLLGRYGRHVALLTLAGRPRFL
ncbi:MAG: nucleotidyltransferase family protein [Chloroflexi bacterium]|nr:nucleotidyltransferase family protein [Chloroflexota bacterium]